MATPFVGWLRIALSIGAVLGAFLGAWVVWRSYRRMVRYNRILAQTVAELERTDETLRRRNQELELLNQAGRAFTATLDPDQVLATFLEETRRVLNVTGASVWLVDAESGDLVCRRAVGPQSHAVEGWHLQPGEGIADWVARHDQMLIVPDTELEPRYDRRVAETIGVPLRSILCVPLRIRKLAIGALELVDTAAGRFGQAEATLVESLASTAAIAMENAQLYVQAQQDAQTKTVLLNEVNHRVKNNLATIAGLLYAEQRHLDAADPQACQSAMADLIHRVQGLAEVHSMLSAAQWAPLLLSDLVWRIVRSAVQGAPGETPVVLEIMPSPVRVTADQAHHLALVINELATNAIKYGADIGGRVTISGRAWMENGQVVLELRDRGPGYPPQVLELGERSVGLALVESIVTQSLRGTLALINDGGAVAVVRFGAEVGEAGADARPAPAHAERDEDSLPSEDWLAPTAEGIAMGDEP